MNVWAEGSVSVTVCSLFVFSITLVRGTGNECSITNYVSFVSDLRDIWEDWVEEKKTMFICSLVLSTNTSGIGLGLHLVFLCLSLVVLVWTFVRECVKYPVRLRRNNKEGSVLLTQINKQLAWTAVTPLWISAVLSVNRPALHLWQKLNYMLMWP